MLIPNNLPFSSPTCCDGLHDVRQKDGMSFFPVVKGKTGCAVDIRCAGKEQMIRYASILLDIANGTKQDLTSSRVCSRSAESMQASRCTRLPADFDELLLEQHGSVCWLHFAVRPKDNRRRIEFLKV